MPEPGALLLVDMKYTRIRTETQALHVGSRSASHERDKAKGDARRQYKFLAVETETRPSRERSFPRVTGVEAIHNLETGRWSLCKGPDDLGTHLVRESASRARYQAWTKRNGHPELMSRVDPAPLSVHTTSLHPAACDLIADILVGDQGGQDLPQRIFAKFVDRARHLFTDRRYLIGAALHADTDDLHIDLVTARNGHAGRLGKAGLGLVGSWCVAVDRQLRAGAKINALKKAQFDRSLANFRRREGADAIPLDILLARTMDAVSAEVLGDQLQPYIARYAQVVPRLEREHTVAALRELDAARQKLIASLAPGESDPLLLQNRLSAPQVPGGDAAPNL